MGNRPTEGLIQLLSALMPTNDNDRQWVTWNEYVQGADQTFSEIAKLISHHPNRMTKGMRARVVDYPLPNNITYFDLIADPADMVDGNGDSIVNGDNFLEFWDQTDQTGAELGFERVYEYSPDGPGGGAPPFPYETDPAFEANWTPIYDASASHKWIRFRDDDVDDNADGIFDHWTAPIPINQAYTEGDYIDNRFRREATDPTLHTAQGTMTDTKYYVVVIGKVVNSTQGVTYFKGTIFQYSSADTLVFDAGTETQETVTPIPRTINGLPNNEPVGWSDTVPAGTDQLWKATAQKSRYGQLKSSWIITKIVEDPNYVRYSTSPSPHPDTIAGVDDDANTSDPADVALVAAGWDAVFESNDVFIATRQDDQNPSSPKYTTWLVEKIAEESGEYVDRVFKLFPVGLDADSPLVNAPTARDATTEGWSDTPVEETANEINYFSEARKFIDGTLKSAWSKPFPYTGQDAYLDTITSDLGDDFQTDQDGNTVPAEIELTAKLYRGTFPLWESADVTLTYEWKKVYDGGAVVDVSPTTGSGDDFWRKPATGGAPGVGEYLADQRVGIKPGAVTGKAVFQCTQTYDPGGGAPVIVFVDTYSILDITDGIDAKSLAVRADAQLIVWDVSAPNFVPEETLLSAFQSNIPTGDTFYWYKWNGASWVEFTAPDANHTFPDGINKGLLKIDYLAGTQNNVPDLVFTVPGVGADATITSAGSNMPAMAVSEQFEIRSHSDPENNGVYEVVTVNTSTSDYEVDKIGNGATAPITAASEAAEIYTSLSSPLQLNQFKEELRYAVTNTQSDPDTADYDTKFSDFITITKLGSTSTGQDGSDSVGMLLSNESHTIALDNTTGDPQSGQTGNGGTATSIVELYDGQTHLDYGVDYTAGNVSIVTQSTDTGDTNDVLFDWEPAGNNIRVFVQAEPGGWDGASGVRSAVGRVSITYGGNTYSKDFTITSTLDAPGAILLDIDSDRGFSFTPTDRANKTLTAFLLDNNVVDTSDNWNYRWLLNDVQVQAQAPYSSNGHIYTLQSSQVQGGAYIKCEVYTNPGGVLTRSRTVYIQDITDAKRYLLYYNYASEPAEPISTPATPGNSTIATFGTDYPASGNNQWIRNPGTWTYWSSEGIEGEDKILRFTAPVRIRGERGDQGLSGRYYIEQYRATGDDQNPPSLPSNTTTPPGGIGNNGWSTTLPGGDIIWATKRLFEADGSTPASGSTWSAAYLITGRDSTIAGPTGPGYSSISDLGITGAGDRRIRFNGVNGASNATFDIPDGPTGPGGPAGADGVTDGTQWVRNIRGNNYGSGNNLTFPSDGFWTGWLTLPHAGTSNDLLFEFHIEVTERIPGRYTTYTARHIRQGVRKYVRLKVESFNPGGTPSYGYIRFTVYHGNTPAGTLEAFRVYVPKVAGDTLSIFDAGAYGMVVSKLNPSGS